jgi:multiple sugar transport system substrate-binding protein
MEGRNLRRRATIMVATVAVVVGLLAAGIAPVTGQSDGSEVVTIDVWNPETGEAVLAALDEMATKFEAENPNIQVNLVTVPWGDIYPKWQAALEAGDPPEVSISSAAYAATLNEQGVLEPLDDVVANLGGDGVWAPTAASFVDMAKKDGSYFQLPFVQNSVLLWYNKQLLADAGIEPPTNWDELRAAAESLTKDGVYGILVTGSKSHVTQHGLYSLMLSNGGDIVDRETGETVIFDQPETVEALDFYADLAQFSPPGSMGYDRPEAQAAMTTGRIAMFIYGSWLGGALQEAGTDVFDQFGVVPVPVNQGPGGSFMGNATLVGFKDADQVEAGKRFLEFMMRDDNYVKWLVADPTSYIPVTAGAQQSPEYLDNEKVKMSQHVIDAAYAGLPNAWVYGLPNPHAGEIEGQNIIAEAAANVLAGMDAQAAATQAADEIRAIIGE